jgi:hypothetical protein
MNWNTKEGKVKRKVFRDVDIDDHLFYILHSEGEIAVLTIETIYTHDSDGIRFRFTNGQIVKIGERFVDKSVRASGPGYLYTTLEEAQSTHPSYKVSYYYERSI